LHPDGSNDCLFLSIRNKRKEAHAIALSVGQSDAARLGRGKVFPRVVPTAGGALLAPILNL